MRESTSVPIRAITPDMSRRILRDPLMRVPETHAHAHAHAYSHSVVFRYGTWIFSMASFVVTSTGGSKRASSSVHARPNYSFIQE